MIKHDDVRVNSFWSRIDISGLITNLIVYIICGVFAIVPSRPLYVPPNDSNSAFPYPGKETIPNTMLIIGIGIIFVIFMFAAILIHKYNPGSTRQFLVFPTIWCFLLCIGVTNMCVCIFKNYVGRPRPSFFSRCGITATNDPKTCPSLSSKTYYEEFRSWPSGHSSTAMAGFLFFSLFTSKLFKSKEFWVTTLSSLYIFVAFFVGSSRIIDYRHHTDDVIAGFFTGALFTLFIFAKSSKKLFNKPKNEEWKHQDVSSPIEA